MIKHRMAALIVKARYWILAGMLACAVLSAFSIGRTKINYDMIRYLSDDTMTKQSLSVMEREFGANEQLRMMFSDLPDESLDAILRTLNSHSDIQLATHDPTKDVRVQDGVSWQLVTVILDDCDVMALVAELRTLFPEAGSYAVGGSGATLLDIQRSVGDEIPVVMVIAVAVVLLVLLLTSHAWVEPAVILLVLSVSIVINMGTNFVFPDVSFITFAVCAILQLALSIDYAIMLLHTYNAVLDTGFSPREAMTEALSQCFMRIASSAFTTVAGLLSLLFMSFTIGFDIGLVLSKGILISMLCVFLLMPALTLIFHRPLLHTRHRPLRLGGRHLAAAIWRARRWVALALVLAVCFGLWLNTRTRYSFSERDADSLSQTGLIDAVFGVSDPLVLLLPGGQEDEDFDRQRELVSRLRALRKADGAPAVEDITSMVTTGAEALRVYTVQDVATMTGQSPLAVSVFFGLNGFGTEVRGDVLLETSGSLAEGNETLADLRRSLRAAKQVFVGPHYGRVLVNLGAALSDRDFDPTMEAVFAEVRAVYGDGFFATGIPMSSYDISHAFHSDLLKVNLITLAAILIIVMLSFRSLFLPLLLVFVIEGAIWITMGISGLLGLSIFFVSYLICLSIQMGATIDYAILLSDQYRTLRGQLPDAKQALMDAMDRSVPTILTSGVILVTAGYIIGKMCTVYYISSIGLLVARGALVSSILVLTLLPALLSLCDRWIRK